MTSGSVAIWPKAMRSTKTWRRSGVMVPQLLSRSSWVATTHPQVASPTTSTSAPTITWPCPGTSSKTDAVSTPTNRIRASAARQPGARIGDDLLQVDGNRDEHQPSEDSRGSRLGQEEVVPFVHVPLLLVVAVVAV